MYQARVDAVKIYYEKQGKELDDALARPRELTLEQYLDSRVDWCNKLVWPHLCQHWSSKSFKKKQKRGQESHFKYEDVAQN